MRIYVKTGLSKNGKNHVHVEYASEGAKTAFTKHCNYKLKLAKSANVVSTLTKFGLMRSSKITVPSKRRSSKYVVFPQRQLYFTYGDLHSSGLKNHAFHLTIFQC